ncbi:MAG: PEP-CTERM sorting domain-containing protein [Candidatus Methylacidiphilales bacterium]|nr:PEP-CTERM sorting domain-containing protein [Candidatus Methylacidiphilales bacterium]
MKKQTLFVLAITLSAGLFSLRAATLLNEDFNGYTIDSTIDGNNGGSGWGGSWATSSPSFGYLHTTRNNVANLSYSGYSAVGGNYANLAGGYGGPAYMDMTRQVDLAGAFSSYVSGGSVGADGTTLWGSFAYAYSAGSTLNLFLSGASTNYVPLADAGVSSLFVFKIDFGAGNADTLTYFLNPNLATFDGTGAPTGTQAGNFSFTRFGFALNGDTHEGRFDTIRMGNLVGDVVPVTIPEPSTYALFGIGMASLAWLRRRQIKA